MMTNVARAVRLARRVAQGMAWRLNTLERRVAPSVQRSLHDETVVGCMNHYDMLMQPDEPYYARQYLRVILAELERRFPHRRISVIDLGCGQGRLSLPLARWTAPAGGKVIGVDLTPSAVAQAHQYAADQGVRNVAFVQGDAAQFAQREADASADAVVFTEVTFFMPSYREVLKELGRILKPGGVAFIAFRSEYYNVMQAVMLRDWGAAKRCLATREGNLFGGDTCLAWQTVDDIHQLMDQFGLRLLRLFGIGVFSGIKGDARGAIVQPAQLSESEQEDLLEIECEAGERYASCGRYILCIAERR